MSLVLMSAYVRGHVVLDDVGRGAREMQRKEGGGGRYWQRGMYVLLARGQGYCISSETVELESHINQRGIPALADPGRGGQGRIIF